MTLSRRRFLTISAAFAGAPMIAHAASWHGRAFGGDISLTLAGPDAVTKPALERARALISRMERLFSLYDPNSALSELNRARSLTHPDRDMVRLLEHCHHAWELTGGLFDPTVQSLWEARALRIDEAKARNLVSWERVSVSARRITLGPQQKLTLNGIAQGYATDVITDMLKDAGMTRVLVNIGEHRALGGPWRLGLHDPMFGYQGTRTLMDRAIATTSPAAMVLNDGGGHILHPNKVPIWSTVSVEADTAVLADSLSTGLAMAPLDQVRALFHDQPAMHRVTLIDSKGDLVTL